MVVHAVTDTHLTQLKKAVGRTPSARLRGAILVGLLIFSACGASDSAPSDTLRGSGVQVARTVDGVCDAAHAASRSETARKIFFDEAHDGLHALAAEVTDVDRSIAAELLRAKENVERLLDGDTPPEQLRLALRFLHQASTDAVVAISNTEPEGCDA